MMIYAKSKWQKHPCSSKHKLGAKGYANGNFGGSKHLNLKLSKNKMITFS